MSGFLELIEPSLLWPTWPSTVLVSLSCIYWLMVIAGAVTVDALHIDFHDFHFDTDVDGSLLDLGFVPLRFLNLGRVPLMLWFSIFALSAWGVSQLIIAYGGLTPPHPHFVFSDDVPAIVRDYAIALLVTKVLTQPLRGLFDVVEPIGAKEMMGKTCVITTGEATPHNGEASFATEGAPLSLNVRVAEGTLEKGELAEIYDYSPEENIYFVKRVKKQEV